MNRSGLGVDKDAAVGLIYSSLHLVLALFSTVISMPRFLFRCKDICTALHLSQKSGFTSVPPSSNHPESPHAPILTHDIPRQTITFVLPLPSRT